MRKGQIVQTIAEVITTYAYDDYRRNIDSGWKIIHEPPLQSNDKSNSRCLCRLEFDKPQSVILIGKTTIQTGRRQPEQIYNDGDYEPPRIISDKHHKVWAVVSYSETDGRYTTPFYILESDIIGA